MEKKEERKELENENEGVMLNSGDGDDQVEETENQDNIIEEAFGESIEYEEISEIEESPINEPVKVGEVSEGLAVKSREQTEQAVNDSEFEEDLPEELLEEFNEQELPPTDAPEQVVDEEESEEAIESTTNSGTQSPIDNADQHAAIAADSFLGIADNVLEIGGGFFIKIKKKKSHLYFDELIDRSQLEGFKKIGVDIDQLNEKNIKRIKLDGTDRALLKPILIEVLKKQTKQLTPEQQLAAIGISIAIKKAQAVMEMKAHNALFAKNLDDRIEKQLARFEKMVAMKESELNVEKDGEEKKEHTQKAA